MGSTLLRIVARLRRLARRLTGRKLTTRKPLPRNMPHSDLAERVRPPAGTLGTPVKRPGSGSSKRSR